jgi:hypothetical protein
MEELEKEQNLTDNWVETAKNYANGVEYYRGLVDEIGKMLGDESYIADDGSRSDEILRAKVPELVSARIKEFDRIFDIGWMSTGYLHLEKLLGNFGKGSNPNAVQIRKIMITKITNKMSLKEIEDLFYKVDKQITDKQITDTYF